MSYTLVVQTPELLTARELEHAAWDRWQNGPTEDGRPATTGPLAEEKSIRYRSLCELRDRMRTNGLIFDVNIAGMWEVVAAADATGMLQTDDSPVGVPPDRLYANEWPLARADIAAALTAYDADPRSPEIAWNTIAAAHNVWYADLGQSPFAGWLALLREGAKVEDGIWWG